MRFYVGQGDVGRYATTLQFVDDSGVTHTVAVVRDDESSASKVVVAGRGVHFELHDVDDVARDLARLLVACREQSLVVGTLQGITLRGDEPTAADVYPPHQHPRIVVKAAT